MNLNWAGCKKKCEIFYWQCFLLSAHNLALRPQKCLKCMVKGHRFSLLLHTSIQLSWAFSKVYIPTTININYFLWHLQFIVLVVYPILTQRNNKAKLKNVSNQVIQEHTCMSEASPGADRRATFWHQHPQQQIQHQCININNNNSSSSKTNTCILEASPGKTGGLLTSPSTTTGYSIRKTHKRASTIIVWVGIQF